MIGTLDKRRGLAKVLALICVVFIVGVTWADFTHTTTISVRNTSTNRTVRFECWVVPVGQQKFIHIGDRIAGPGQTVTWERKHEVMKSTNYWIELRETYVPDGPSNHYRWQEIDWNVRTKTVPWSTPGLGSGADYYFYLTVKALPVR